MSEEGMSGTRAGDSDDVRVIVARIEGLGSQFAEFKVETREKLEEIHGEVRSTNGRVSDLETNDKIAQALEKQADVRRERREWIPPAAMNGVYLVAGALLAHFLA